MTHHAISIGISVFVLSACAKHQEPAGETNAATSHAVVITSVDPSREILAIKAVREETGLGLADAKRLVDDVPSTVKDGLSVSEARAMVDRLEKSGMKAETRP